MTDRVPFLLWVSDTNASTLNPLPKTLNILISSHYLKLPGKLSAVATTEGPRSRFRVLGLRFIAEVLLGAYFVVPGVT